MKQAHIDTFEFKREMDTGCPSCGCIFRGERAFDKHRVGEHGVDRTCLVPRDEPRFKMDHKGRWGWE